MVFKSEETHLISKEEALKKFVNRDNPLLLMKESYARLTELMKTEKSLLETDAPDHAVIDYYGIGGKGKTSLIQKLNSEVPSDFIIWDIDKRKNQGIVEVLLYLRQKLVRNHGFEFPRFDKLAEAFFVDENLNFTQFDRMEYQDAGTDFVKDASTALLDNFTFGLTNSVINLIKNVKETHSKKKSAQELRDLAQMEAMEIWEQVKLIKTVFQNEYNENILKRERPMIIYVDTFELYNLDKTWLFTGQDSTMYSYGLCHSLAFTLWVFAGRDSLMLTTEDKWEPPYFHQMELKNFAKETSLFF